MTIKQLLKKIFYIPTPSSLPIDGFERPGEYTWGDWKIDVKKKYPIRYFFSYTIPHILNVYIWMNLIEVKYYIVSHTIRKYHWLDLRQPKTYTEDDYDWGWIDEDRQMIFAMFNILLAHVKIINESSYHYSATPECADKLLNDNPECVEQANSLKEMYELCQYWTIERKEKLKEKEQISTNAWENRKNDPKWWEKIRDLEEKIIKREEEMLIRLIKIRHNLWS